MTIEKYCVTCGEDGHTYLECKNAPFANIVADAFGIPPLMTPKPAGYDETMRRMRERAEGRDAPSGAQTVDEVLRREP